MNRKSSDELPAEPKPFGKLLAAARKRLRGAASLARFAGLSRLAVHGKRAWPWLLGGALLANVAWFSWPPQSARIRGGDALTLLSREGAELRAFREREGGSFTARLALSEYPGHLVRAVLTAEDQRFAWHPGIDPLALTRATWQNLKHGRIVSGGSTITQQLARMAYADQLPANAWLRKPVEALYALCIDLHFSKAEILEAYLNRAPLRYNRTGFAAGARRLFGRDPRLLTERESIALAALIRRSNATPANFRRRFLQLYERIHAEAAPAVWNDELPDGLEARIFQTNRDAVARADGGDPEGAKHAGATDGAAGLADAPAPHFSAYLRERYPGLQGEVRTEISANRNQEVERILGRELEILRENQASNGAVVVLEIDPDNESFVLRALVGSEDFADDEAGQVNGALAVRNAGSTLKPFIYGLAFDELDLRPFSIVEDSPTALALGGGDGVYTPRNYDLNYWGVMTAREALATSRNIPAVALVQRLGPDRFYQLLKKAGLRHLQAGPREYGPGLALGAGGVSLLDLTRMYAALADGGRLHPVRLAAEQTTGAGGARSGPLVYGEEAQLLSSQAAHLLTHVLSDRDARRRAFGDRSFLDFPFAVAAKTGTSKDYRDSWTVGFTARYAIGVWIGNFSGDPMRDLSGAYGAGRVFQQTMRLFAPDAPDDFTYPPGWRRLAVCRHTGLAAAPGCPHLAELLPAGEAAPRQCPGPAAHDNAAMLAVDDAHSEGFSDSPSSTYNQSVVRSPAPGERFFLDPHAPRSVQRIPLRLAAPGPGYVYQVNDGPQQAFQGQVNRALDLNPGRHRVRIYRNGALLETVSFTVE